MDIATIALYMQAYDHVLRSQQLERRLNELRNREEARNRTERQYFEHSPLERATD